jgi:inhibitor of cysteine peptidase
MTPVTRQISLAIILLALGLSHSYGAETVIVNKAFNGREIKLRTGSAVQVELEQPGATGFSWEIQNFDKEHFQVLSVKTDDRKPGGDLTGTPVLKTWRIRAVKAGKSNLSFLNYRPWEGEKNAADSFVLNILILGTR